MGPISSLFGPCTPRPCEIKKRKALGLKPSEIDPFVIRTPVLHRPHLTFLYGSYAPNPRKCWIKKKDPIGSRMSHWQGGPTCQDLLLHSARVKEREENEFGQSRPLDNQFFSPNKREEKGEKGEPFDETNGCQNGENWSPVPKSPFRSIQWYTLLKIKLKVQERSKKGGDMFCNLN